MSLESRNLQIQIIIGLHVLEKLIKKKNNIKKTKNVIKQVIASLKFLIALMILATIYIGSCYIF